MNCAALSSNGSTIAIDCGVGFTDELGADMMHADFEWLYERGDELEALVITHGHEDHIGALPYFLKEMRVPVYAPPYAAALIRDRLDEHRIRDIELHVGGPGSRFDVGAFSVERFGVHHSIADATGLIIDTPAGTVVHTGDFKIESDPCDGQRFDRARLGRVAERGVRLLLSDSTGADVDGTSGVERTAEAALREQISQAEHRVVVATFSSNVFRLRSALQIAKKAGRRVCLLGMSVNKHLEAATSLGLLPPTDALLVSPEEAASLPRASIMVIAGGTQGEAGSSLTRLARQEHTQLRLAPGDKVILSSRIIPGNELAVFDLINRFERQGIEVVTRRSHPDVHASGHGSREEQAEMISLLAPRAFVPVHGTHHHLRRHAELARRAGVEEIEVIGNGSVLEVTDAGLRVVGRVPTGRVYIERMTPLGEGVMEDRRAMATGGLLTILLTLRGGRLRREPRVLAHGIVGDERRDRLEEALSRHIRGRLKGRRFAHPEDAEDAAIETARRFLVHNERKRPLIDAVVDEES